MYTYYLRRSVARPNWSWVRCSPDTRICQRLFFVQTPPLNPIVRYFLDVLHRICRRRCTCGCWTSVCVSLVSSSKKPETENVCQQNVHFITLISSHHNILWFDMINYNLKYSRSIISLVWKQSRAHIIIVDRKTIAYRLYTLSSWNYSRVKNTDLFNECLFSLRFEIKTIYS